MGKVASLDKLQGQKERLAVQEALALEKAFKSNDVEQIVKAQQYLKGLEKKEEVDFKSILVDPMELTSSFGYKDKPYNLSYDVLRAMSRTHIIKAIIETRKDQVASFCEPQRNKYSSGFVIQKKQAWRSQQKEEKLTKAEERRINELIEFLLGCGTTENFWSQDTFDTFVKKIVSDSLTLDQATFEVVRNRQGIPVEFFATDGATYRIADSYDQDDYKKKEVEVAGYVPSYVQIYQNKILAEFYPWELCFGVRNPSTDIRLNGYGKSELEDMIQTITAILNADFYNANFFKVGSAPKGILKYSGNINPNTVEDFRRQWIAQVSGVMNMHKIPMINADKLDFINTAQNNKDMEYAKYQEFLIKISCAIFKIDPSEIGFPMAGAAETNAFGGSTGNEEKLRYSKDKGLKPLLKQVQYWINKYLISQIDNSYEFRFVGIDGEADETQELEADIKMLSNFMTLNEIRAKRNLPPMPDGDVILNPTYLQAKGMAQQGDPNANEAVDQMNSDEGSNNEGQEDNPFMKSLQEDIGKILSE